MTGANAPVVDIHCHLFSRVSRVGVDLEAIEPKNRADVMLDAGSAGPRAFATFVACAREAKSGGLGEIYGLVNVAEAGLDKAPEIAAPGDFQPERAAAQAVMFPDVARGLKVRAVQPALGMLGMELIAKTIRVADDAQLPIMVHFGQQDGRFDEEQMLTSEILDALRPGDIASHVFTGQSGGIFSSDRNFAAAKRARERGVLFDVGHGGFNFDIAAARKGRELGFGPDFVSSDVTSGTAGWLSLPYAMSAVASAGFPSEDIIAATTDNAARWLGVASHAAHRRIEVLPGQGAQKDSFGTEYDVMNTFVIADRG